MSIGGSIKMGRPIIIDFPNWADYYDAVSRPVIQERSLPEVRQDHSAFERQDPPVKTRDQKTVDNRSFERVEPHKPRRTNA